MRHRKIGRKLNRDSAHRNAMFKNMAISLMTHEFIKTTLPKAKELRRVIEPIITMAKNDSVNNRRRAFAKLGNKKILGKLFTELGPRYQERPGGYVRILKCGTRAGDAAPMAYVELVDRPLMDINLDDDDDLDITTEVQASEKADNEQPQAEVEAEASQATAEDKPSSADK